MIIYVLKKLNKFDFYNGMLDIIFKEKKIEYEITSYQETKGIFIMIKNENMEINRILNALHIEYDKISGDEEISEFFNFLDKSFKVDEEYILRNIVYCILKNKSISFKQLANLRTFIIKMELESKKEAENG